MFRRMTLGVAATLGMAWNVGAAQPQIPRPVPGPPKPFVFPPIQTQTLPNGLRLAVVENHEVPVVAVRIGIGGGAAVEPVGQEGAWSVMMTALSEGTTTRSLTALTDAAADIGTSIVYPLNRGDPPPYFTTVKSAWPAALNLVADVLMNPAFPAAGIGGVQNRIARTLQPTAVVTTRNAFFRALSGPNHPYSRVATDSSVRALTAKDVAALHNAYVRPQNTLIVVTGDVTPAEARAVVDKAFGSWQRGTSPTVEPVPVPVPTVQQTTIFLRNQTGLQNGLILAGYMIPGRNSPDALALDVLSSILGGGLDSRIAQHFRVSRGLLYSFNSSVLPRQPPEPSTLSLTLPTVPNASIDTAVVEMVRVVRELRESKPVTAAELDLVRKNMINGYPLRFESVTAIAAQALVLVQSGRDGKFFSDQVQSLNALTLLGIQAVAKQYLDPDHLVIAITGDTAKIAGPLRATGIPVVIVDR